MLEDLQVPDLTVFPADRAGLVAFNREYGHFNCALLPGDRSFALVLTVDDYYLVAGDLDFVESAVGCSIERARSRFEAHAKHAWGGADKVRLLDVASRCAIG